MGTPHLVIGLTVTVAGLAAAMSILLIVSRLVDLASRQREGLSTGAVEAKHAEVLGASGPATPVAGRGPRYTPDGAPGDGAVNGARAAATMGDSTDDSPARSRSLHLHLRVAGNDYDVEVQPVGQAA